jgi:hypothetical protein
MNEGISWSYKSNATRILLKSISFIDISYSSYINFIKLGSKFGGLTLGWNLMVSMKLFTLKMLSILE